LDFVGIHFYRTDEERLAQARALAAAYAETEVPVILAGDFNSTPDSAVIEFLSRRWHFIDKGADRLTFSSMQPEIEIDFVALWPGDAFRVVSQRLLDEPVISDHRPLFVELEW
jgi:endonuclease/exonuclease/phosphatase family metal-dependent hydrolase